MLNIIQNTIGALARRVLSIVKDGLKMWLPFENSEILGEDVVTNGDFATDSDWTKGTGWSISGGSANCNNTSGSTQDLETTNRLLNLGGKDIKITFTVSNYSGSASMSVTLEGTGETDFTGINANGTYSKVVTLGVGENSVDFFFKAANGWVGSIDNVSLQEVTQIAPDKSGNSNGATLYTGKALSFDGVNDYVDFGLDINNNRTVWTTAIWISNYTRGSYDWIYGDTTQESIGLNYDTGVDGNIFYRQLNDTFVQFSCDVFKSDFTNAKRLVFTSDGTDIKLYLDGVYIDKVTPSATNLKLSRLMAGYDTSSFMVDATVSDFQLYNVAWTQADVTFDYENPQHLVTDNSASSIALSNLKGYWHLSEGAGAINYDSSGEDNNGAISGATWVPRQATIPQLGLMDWSKPTIGSDVVTLISDPNDPSEDILGNDVRLREHSLNLDGIGYAQVADDDSLNFGTGAFSIDGWAKYTFVNSGSSTGNAIYSNGGTTTAASGNFAIATRSTASAREVRFYINGVLLIATVTSDVADGAWFYFAGTRDASGNFKLYINDLSAVSQSQTGNSGATVTTTNVRYIGRDSGVNRYYKNLVDDIRLYNIELSADEVLQNYKAGLNQHKTGSSFSDDFSSDYGF